jgi:hypothetical protein
MHHFEHILLELFMIKFQYVPLLCPVSVTCVCLPLHIICMSLYLYAMCKFAN